MYYIIKELIFCLLFHIFTVNSMYPIGHCVQVLGKESEKTVETAVLLHEFGVSNTEFSTEVMSCLPNSDWKITENLISQRVDLRFLPVVSIDPPGCKDIDDALHCINVSLSHYLSRSYPLIISSL